MESSKFDSAKIHVVSDINDPYAILAVEDPVRPDIPLEERLEPGKEMIMLMDDTTPLAIVCVSYQDTVPTTEAELVASETGKIAVFYTIWSYAGGAGKRLLLEAKTWIKNNRLHVVRFVTLSPTTEVAKKFHLSNGAIILAENEDSVNYEYLN
jgi:hypothetical protein